MYIFLFGESDVMIHITLPNNFIPERTYICHVIFSEFLGIEYDINFLNDAEQVLLVGLCGSIRMEDSFFLKNDDGVFTEDSLPVLPLPTVIIDHSHHKILPILFGSKNAQEKFLEIIDNDVYCGIDILGSAFFMLTRIEEYILRDRDENDRFPAQSSIAYKAGFLNRPLVNEYVELLWFFLKQIEPSLECKKRQYKVIPTHDIDKPFGMMFDTPLQIARHFAGDIVYRRSPKAVLKRALEVFQLCFATEQYIAKKGETFAFINRESRKHNLKDVFFFMNSKKSWYDGNYTVDEPHVLGIISKLVSQGHYIGLHPSFDSYMDSDKIKREVALMNDVFSNNKLPLLVGSRQHYLKWKNPNTWQYYEDAGIPFDSSMTFAGHVGFRCGVCYPFPVFNLETRKQLKLIEHPLIVMDGTLYEYMGLSHGEALPVIKKLADECKKYNGEFVILWHNTMLDSNNEREFYSKMLDEVCCE